MSEIKHKILVVDDEPSIRKFIIKALESDEIQVDSCGDGREAFRLITSGDYELVLMDLRMPDWEGIDAIRALDLTEQYPRVIVFSAFIDDQTRNELSKYPCVIETFDKPGDIEKLKRLVEAIVVS